MELESNNAERTTAASDGSATQGHDDLMARNRAAIRLLDEWLADESGYDEETWPQLKAALQANRPSGRRLFSD